MKIPMFERGPLAGMSRRELTRLATVGLIVFLMIVICIFACMRVNIQKKYTAVRTDTGTLLYAELYMFCQTFDQVDVPGASVQGSVLPQLRKRYQAASAYNTVLIGSFGERYGIMDATLVARMEQAFAAYDAAFENGTSTDVAKASMSDCVTTIRTLLSQRYKGDVIQAR